MIYLLLVVFIALLYFTYLKFDKDVVAPPVVLVAGYTFSIICASVNVERWGIDLHFNTFGVLVYGTLLFVVTGYIVKNYVQKKAANNVSTVEKLEPINVNGKYLYLFIVFQLLVMAVWVWNIYSVTDTLGTFNSFSERMVAFRRWSSYDTGWINNYWYVFINQFNQISTISPYLFLYIIISNYFIKKNDFVNKGMICSVILSIAQMLLTGGRLGVVSLFLAVCLYYFVFYQKKFGYKFQLNKIIAVKAVIAIILGGLGFYLSKAVVGRGAADISIANIVPYLTMYIGGPIQLLDMFLQNPIEPSDIWGKEVFSTLNFQLIRFGFLDIEPYIIHLEFRIASTGAFLGNIYTAYRSYLYDFGLAGLTILPVIFSATTNYLYYKIVCSKNGNGINLLLLFYSTIFWSLFFDFVRCFFFAGVCCFATIKQFVILIFLTAIFVRGFGINNLLKKDKAV